MGQIELQRYSIRSVYGTECIYAPGKDDVEKLYSVICPTAFSMGITVQDFPGYADENCYFQGTRDEWLMSACKDNSMLSFGLDHGERKIEPESRRTL